MCVENTAGEASGASSSSSSLSSASLASPADEGDQGDKLIHEDLIIYDTAIDAPRGAAVGAGPSQANGEVLAHDADQHQHDEAEPEALRRGGTLRQKGDPPRQRCVGPSPYCAQVLAVTSATFDPEVSYSSFPPRRQRRSLLVGPGRSRTSPPTTSGHFAPKVVPDGSLSSSSSSLSAASLARPRS